MILQINKSLKLIGVTITSGLLFALVACEQKDHSNTKNTTPQPPAAPYRQMSPTFDADSAFQYVKAQVEMGPRNPGSKGHQQCGDLLVKYFQRHKAEVKEQKTIVTGWDGKKLPCRNIIAAYNPTAARRVMLCAHWDTRPLADQDTKDRDKPILGANDGASGVAVLMEIARHLADSMPGIGIDLILFDVEDYGNSAYSDSYCLGSQYWAKNLHVPGYKPEFGILLDMVGAPNATFAKEGVSMTYAPQYTSLVWNTARQLGYGNYFPDIVKNEIIDDHYYVNMIAGIPTLDIIHYDASSQTGFGKYWHTHQDNLDAVDKNTLKAVGQTLLEVIYTR